MFEFEAQFIGLKNVDWKDDAGKPQISYQLHLAFNDEAAKVSVSKDIADSLRGSPFGTALFCTVSPRSVEGKLNFRITNVEVLSLDKAL